MSKQEWFVIASKRHREEFAYASLGEIGIRAYLPRIVQWPRPAVGGEIAPMFPGYLFVYAAFPDDFYRVGWTPGVKAFVTFGGLPAPLAPQVIDFLRSREGADGVIRCGSGITEPREVRIIRGPFQGLTAIVTQRLPARERVRVLMDILQRQTSVELPERWVARL